jgi:hypothetical protein
MTPAEADRASLDNHCTTRFKGMLTFIDDGFSLHPLYDARGC